MRPLALDLFCGAGGASMGLHRAGFDVIGVDIKPQPRFPFRFVQADALRPPFDLAMFDFIWASPMCQRYSVGSARWGKEWPDQIPVVRKILEASGVLWCIENVPGAPIRRDLVFTGPMFGLNTQRRRHFELSFFWLAPSYPERAGPQIFRDFVTVAGHGGHGSGRLVHWQKAMEIDWMSKRELTQSVPPAYSEFIGRAALQHLGRIAA